MSVSWDELKEEIVLSDEEQEAVKLEEKLIETLIQIREKKGLSQTQLSKMSNVKQPSIARMEKQIHSPQIGSLLKLLVPMGYTLEIVPIKKHG